MSFVGTRPEVVKYVKKYKPEYFATLLLPAGITSEASIKYKDEAELLDAAEDVDEVYITKVLPEKMKYNLSKQEKKHPICLLPSGHFSRFVSKCQNDFKGKLDLEIRTKNRKLYLQKCR